MSNQAELLALADDLRALADRAGKEWFCWRQIDRIEKALRLAASAPAGVPLKKTYIKPLRTIVEIDARYANQIRDLLNTASAPAGDGGEVKLLEWEEQLTKRSDEDPSTEVTGYEAETAFGTFYTVEVGAALFHVVYDYKGLGAFETEIAAKAAAQADYEQRIRSALYARPAPAVEVREALESAANWMQRYLDTFGELGDDATQANIDDWHALSASPREMVQESDDGAPGLNWKLSDETKKQIAEIESNQRHAFANLNNIIAGCPSEPSPSSRSETAWQSIETAPHNTSVLLGWRDWRDGQWCVEVGAATTGQRYDNGYSSISLHGSATHWRSLPSEGPL